MSSKRGGGGAGGGGGGLIKGVGRAPGRNYVQVKLLMWLGRRVRKKDAQLTYLIGFDITGQPGRAPTEGTKVIGHQYAHSYGGR